jgi:hypothetical protein
MRAFAAELAAAATGLSVAERPAIKRSQGSFALQEVGPRGWFAVDWQSVKKYSLAGKLTSGRYKAFRITKVERSH